VTLLAHKTALNIVAAQRREADLTRQIAHKQSRLAFGAGRACTKALQMGKHHKDVIPEGVSLSGTL